MIFIYFDLVMHILFSFVRFTLFRFNAGEKKPANVNEIKRGIFNRGSGKDDDDVDHGQEFLYKVLASPRERIFPFSLFSCFLHEFF